MLRCAHIFVLCIILPIAPFQILPRSGSGVGLGTQRTGPVRLCAGRSSSLPAAALMMHDDADEDRRRLEIAYRASLGNSAPQQLDFVHDKRANIIEAGRLEQLPIWACGGAMADGSKEPVHAVMLPGQQTLLEVPIFRCKMFEQLLNSCEPHLFGAIVLENKQEESVGPPLPRIAFFIRRTKFFFNSNGARMLMLLATAACVSVCMSARVCARVYSCRILKTHRATWAH